MENFCYLLLLTISFHHLLSFSDTSETLCHAGGKHRMSLSINSARNKKDEWTTKFSASRNVSSKPKIIDVEVIQSGVDCDDNYFINVQGIIKGDADEDHGRGLFFYNKCSRNAAIINNGITLKKLKLDGAGSAITNRPLKDDEIFTVRIDKMDTKFDHAIGIGVTTFEPGFDIPDHMNNLKTNVWMLYHAHLYHKSEAVFIGYMNKNLKDVKVGQHVGVMRSKTGALHFFLDGVDQGPAASNIPDKVYGVLETFGNLVEGTIVDSFYKMELLP